ncbi:hypothetical protein H2200_005563 [Cladophialophora chaetospira]|uniref:Uncharacterized protein n=1 Tax=Cladophialophora chaetospira TaxID=386627 RepID=A0AA39CJZ0_9EURO|nr:hypothetical protein H2200_005563 [Cladophialophora chaetospira]
MPAMAPTTRPPDDFDMAKLQKTLKQRQKQAVRNSAKVAKLSPAEIRSLNNLAVTSQPGNQSSIKSTSSPSRSRRSTNTTPPVTPDDPPAYQTQTHRNSVSRNNSINVPTPPHTPNGRRRSSQSSTHGHHHHHPPASAPVHGHANGVIYAPRPRVSAQASFMVASASSSRPSSSGSSTYRGLPTYRGPEVTRTGSINMLQYPSQQIVNNPLSYFSRPRQSQVSTSPERSRHEAGEVSIYRAQSLRNTRANSLPYVSAPSSRQPSPPRVTDSPVSMIDDTEKFPVFNPDDDPHNQPKIQSDEEDALKEPVKEAVDSEPPKSTLVAPVVPPQPSQEAEQGTEVTVPDSPRKEKDKRRFTLHAALFGGDKAKTENPEKKLKKARRRSMPTATPDDVAVSGANQEPSDTVPDEAENDGATAGEGDFTAHPAIRPLSLIIPGDINGKEREITSAPVYGRCACCGKIKRPHAFNSELSPVLENENLRTNFSFEIERTSGSSGRRSSDASRSKYIPIIPMQVGENETRQASIQPWDGPSEPPSEEKPQERADDMEIAVSSPVRQPIRQKIASPVRMKRNSVPPRFTRFGSLHGQRHGGTGPIEEEDEDLEHEHDEIQPLMSDQGGMRDSTIQTMDFATMSGDAAPDEQMATSQPPLEEISSAERAFIEPIPMTTDNWQARDEIAISQPHLETSSAAERAYIEAMPTTTNSSQMRDEIATSQPHLEISSAERAFIEPMSSVTQAQAQESTGATSKRTSADSGSDSWYTPAQGLTPVVETGIHPAYYASVVQQPGTHNHQSGVIDGDDQDNSRPFSMDEPPLSTSSTATTVTIITPTSASTATSKSTSVSSPSGWERELTATFLGPANGVDLSLRPKFSFESMTSAINVVDKGKSAGSPEKPAGKRRSMPGLLARVGVKG